jgi:hypothetical protein
MAKEGFESWAKKHENLATIVSSEACLEDLSFWKKTGFELICAQSLRRE